MSLIPGRYQFDTIVIGVGGMGSAACEQLARRGLKVLGLEQFPLVHHQGSSHGETRIIRKAYFEHPDYVPLLTKSYEGWADLERRSGRHLFERTGLVISGPAEGLTIAGARQSAQEYQIPVLNFHPVAATERFPGLRFPADHDVVFEPGAGTLFVEDCVQTHIEQAVQYGAMIHASEPVESWMSDGQQVCVRTKQAEYTARSLVLTAGAWASSCLTDVGIRFQVLRKFLGWFPVRDQHCCANQGCPTFFYELGDRTFYGFPSFDGKTVKVAEHSGGQPLTNPADINRDCDSDDVVFLEDCLKQLLPGVVPQLNRHAICLYTLTTDQHFVVDLHPSWSNVSFAAGFSGHGFKFCPVIGQALADLAERKSTDLPIQFLSANRPGLG